MQIRYNTQSASRPYNGLTMRTFPRAVAAGVLAAFFFVAAPRALGQDVRVPLSIDQGVLLLHARINNVGPLLFVFDPGSGAFITTYAQARLGKQSARTLRIGGASIAESMPVFPGDPAQLDPGYDTRLGVLAGSIGPDLLRHYVVRVDFPKKDLALIPFRQFSAPRGAAALRLRFDPFGMPVIDARVDHATGPFELDLRAPTTMLFKPFADAHDLSRRYASAPVLKSAGTRVQHSLSQIELGPYTVKDVPTWFSADTSGKFAQRTIGGLLGNNVLSHFVVTLDYRSGIVYLERSK